MNRQTYLAALRNALAGLPEEELANVLRYYEEYFDDAGEENEQRAIDELGLPQSVAAQILEDYRELTIPKHDNQQQASAAQSPYDAQNAPRRPRHSVLSAIGLIFLVLLASPFLIAIIATLIGLVIAAIGILISVLIILLAIPLSLLCIGVGFIVFAFMSLGHLPSALATFGAGVMILAIGVMVSIAFIKLCTLIVPPVFRGFINLCRWIFKKIAGLFTRTGGAPR